MRSALRTLILHKPKEDTMAKEKPENVVKFEPKEKSDKQIKKIQYKNSKRTVTVSFAKQRETGKEETDFNGCHEVTKEYSEAIQKMVDVLYELKPQLKEEFKKDTTLTSISLTYQNDEMMGMVLSAQIVIPDQNSPHNEHTPFTKFLSFCENNGTAETSCVTISKENQKLLEKVFSFTERYIKGESAKEQTKLPLQQEG